MQSQLRKRIFRKAGAFVSAPSSRLRPQSHPTTQPSTRMSALSAVSQPTMPLITTQSSKLRRKQFRMRTSRQLNRSMPSAL